MKTVKAGMRPKTCGEPHQYPAEANCKEIYKNNQN